MTTTTVNEGDKVNIKIKKGSTYEHTFTYVDSSGAAISVTGYTARMQIRETIDATAYVYQALSGGDITVGGSDGKFTLSIPAATTAAWTFASGVYDIEIVSPAGKVIGLVGVSRVTTLPEVTR